jgi:hypothetical protein
LAGTSGTPPECSAPTTCSVEYIGYIVAYIPVITKHHTRKEGGNLPVSKPDEGHATFPPQLRTEK